MNYSFTRIALAVFVMSAALHGTVASAESSVAFDIIRFEVIGNTQLTTIEIDEALSGFTGKRRDFSSLEKAMQALEKLYRDKGFKMTIVRLTEQELDRGVVRLNVVETRIGAVRMTGNNYFDEKNIVRSLPSLIAESSPNLDAISSQIKIANEHPSKKVTVKLASDNNENAVDAIVEVQEVRPWGVSLDIDNTGQPQTGTTNVRTGFQHTNILGLDHQINILYSTTMERPNQVLVYGGNYRIPFYPSGDSVEFYGTYSDVDSGNVRSGLLNFDISGKGSVWGVKYNKRLGDTRNSEAKVTVGVETKRLKDQVLLSGYDLGGEISVRPLNIGYTNQWPLYTGQLNASFVASQNIPGSNNGGSEDFSKNRVGASDSFRLYRYSLAYSQSFNSGSQLHMAVNGQETADALVSSEQFGAGGANSVRGFSERAFANDGGAIFNAEWYTPNLCTFSTDWNCLVVGFYDSAFLRRNLALPNEIGDTVISSVGAGVRLAMGTRSSLQLDWGHVIRTPDADTRDANRMHLRASFRF